MTKKMLFCNLISAALFPETHAMPEIRPEEYSAVHEMLANHALVTLPEKILEAEGMPEALHQQWLEGFYAQKRRFGQYLFQQDTLLGWFRQAQIPCAIMKGTVSASYYPEPACRAMGDIDLLIRPEDLENAVGLLEAKGFQKFGYSDAVERSFIKGALIVELHIGAFSDGAFADAINAFLWQQFENIQEKELYGFSFPCLDEECNGLVMLEHLHHHFRDRLGFRQVIDWMMYVDGHLDDDAWKNGMGSLLRQFGLESFAIAITAMCQKYFGLRTAGISWTQSAEQSLCEELFRHIDAMGNFGKKLEANGNSAAGMLRDRTLPQVLMGLQKVGLDNWALCHRHPWLRPFAWLYQIGCYLYRIVAEKWNLSVLLVRKERRRVRDTLALMDKLGLKE